jgi:hypothetical protein
MELAPYQSFNEISPKEFHFNRNSVVAERYFNKNIDKTFDKSFTAAQKIAQDSGAKSLFHTTTIALNPDLKLFYRDSKSRKYNFENEDKTSPYHYEGMYKNDNTPDVQTLPLAPSSLYQTFLFKNHRWTADSGKIPIMLPLSKLEAMLGIKSLDKNASFDQQLARIREIREKAVELEFTACTYNSIANANYASAISYEKSSTEERKAYQLVYNKPDSLKCVIPTINRDTRTASEKKLAANTAIFNHEFDNTPLEAKAHELTYQVVGALPNRIDWDGQDFVNSLLQTIVGQTFMTTIVPTEMFFQLTNLKDILTLYDSTIFNEQHQPIAKKNYDSDSSLTFFMEYDDPKQVRYAVDHLSCHPNYYGIDSSTDNCPDGNKILMMNSFGSRAADLISVKEAFYRGVKIVGIVFIIIATIIMAGTVGRLIADSRRETAVFRAIGFKRFDVSSIYLTYNFLTSLLIILATFILAFITANIINAKLSPALTSQIIWLFGTYDSTEQFSVIGFNWLIFGLISATIIVVGILGAFLPLLRNLRRNPIKDMRDE